MVSENLKEWIKSKREEGISDERIRKSLEETGHDPSVLDELDNPFDSDGSNKMDSEEDGELMDDDFSFTGKEDQENKSTEKDVQPKEGDDKDTKSKFKELESNVQASVKTTKNSFPKKKAASGIFLILLIAGGITAYSFMPSNIDLPESTDGETELEQGSLEQLDAQHSGCPDSAVRIQSVSSSEGVTTADVRVSREEAQVALIVMENDKVLDFTTDTLLGETQMTVNEVGDQVKLRPLGCKDRFSLRDY